MKVLFIGAGNMAHAIINGIVSKSVIYNSDIYIYDINRERSEKVSGDFSVSILDEIDSSVSGFDIIILAVKPQVFLDFRENPSMKILSGIITQDQLIISIMAGISINTLKDFFGESRRFVRIMPNTPALIGESMSIICKSDNVDSIKFGEIKKIFEAIGKVEIMDEKYFDAVTALSGSGPAYVFVFIEALTQGGILCGLPRDMAERLAVQTLIGSGMMVDHGSNPEELRHKVTSPAGTTIEGISVLEKYGFRSAVIEAVRAAYKRSKELNMNS